MENEPKFAQALALARSGYPASETCRSISTRDEHGVVLFARVRSSSLPLNTLTAKNVSRSVHIVVQACATGQILFFTSPGVSEAGTSSLDRLFMRNGRFNPLGWYFTKTSNTYARARLSRVSLGVCNHMGALQRFFLPGVTVSRAPSAPAPSAPAPSAPAPSGAASHLALQLSLKKVTVDLTAQMQRTADLQRDMSRMQAFLDGVKEALSCGSSDEVVAEVKRLVCSVTRDVEIDLT